ncbi:hypothetical protein FHX15_005381 [Rhizobium sp. BK650]|uniref:hypothetical protein n=1 Tax=Rhizobium sp. BK650 TaxID=2586990 RepID=UPI00161EADE9|nr:hypothetical protein [Rhizobium sp. BK650]MBB3660112.1 hypothetical protein [Rhizobium sp. BK650]
MSRSTLASMSAERREAVMRALASMLQYSAGVAKLQQDPLWKEMDVLAAELLQNADAIAQEISETAETAIGQAIRLLSEYEISHPSTNFSYH